jgi:hypothetical protein
MRRVMIGRCGILTGLLLLAAIGPASGGVRMPEPPLPQRVVLADCILVGRITALEAEPVHAFPLLRIAGAPKVAHQIAVVELQTAVAGAKGVRQLRVGYIAPPPPDPAGLSRPRRPQIKLTVGQEGCFFLRKHPEEEFYIMQTVWDLHDKAAAKDFGKDMALVTRCVRLLDDSDAALRAKDAGDRLLTAAMLIFRYRTVQWVYSGRPKTEPISAGQSKLILAALAEGTWTKADADSPMGRLRLLLRLGLTEQDGWKQPASVPELPAAAEEWLRAHRDTYRIQRYVPDEKPADRRQ